MGCGDSDRDSPVWPVAGLGASRCGPTRQEPAAFETQIGGSELTEAKRNLWKIRPDITRPRPIRIIVIDALDANAAGTLRVQCSRDRRR